MLIRLFLPLLFALPLYSQTFTASVSGRVTDPAGLPITGADILVTAEHTGITSHAITGSTGDYAAPYLQPGTYRIRLGAPGFKDYLESGIELEIAQQRRIDAVLQPGDRHDSVTVEANPQQINLVSPEISHTIGSTELLNLPELATQKNGRSPFLLAALLPGVTATVNTYTNINNFSFGGGRPVTNEILVDGMPTTNPSDETYTLTPSPDSIQEFQVVTSPFSAEYGHTGGAVMMATTRMGSNSLHGSAYDLFRNRILNARDFFAATNSARYVENDPGGTIGGPASIPGLYDGRNKTFFFVDFNVTLDTQGNVYSTLTPTDLQKSGDFSQTTAGGQTVVIYDPATAHLAADGQTVIRNAFPGNEIPAARIDPVAAQILKFFPEPNGNFTGNNYFVTPPTRNKVWQYLGRLDRNFTADDRAFFRFGQYSPNMSPALRIPNAANNTTSNGWTDTQAVLGETHVFGPSLVNDFRAGWVQEDNYTGAGGGAVPQLGLEGVDLTAFPTISVSQLLQLGSSAPNHDRDRSWIFNDSLTWQRGTHSIKAGGDFRRQMYDYYDPGKLSGSYTFSGAFTSQTPNGTGSGLGLADLLLGLPATTSISTDDYTFRENINSASAFIEDRWKVSGKLTLSLGLRWEFDGPYSEANNQFASFIPTLTNRATGTPGDVAFAGRNGEPTHFSPNIYHDFLPRVGLAWNFMPNTVFRAGYGIFRLPSIGYATEGPVSQYAVNATFQSPDNNVTPAYQLANGVPAYSYNVNAAGLPNVPASLTNPVSNVTALDTRTRTPYNQSWEAGFQRQFRGNWFAELDYAGMKGTKLPVLIPLNQLPESEWGISPTPQTLRPFPQYLNVSFLSNDGDSAWHSLQASLKRRWSAGVLTVSYTWSKGTDDVDPPADSSPIQNIYNLRGEHSVSSFDVSQRLVANSVYRLPFHLRGTAGRIVNGWSISAIAQFQTGLPLAVMQSNGTGGFTGTQRPNQIASATLPSGQQTLAHWFNTGAFVVAAPFTAGDEARFSFFGPGIENVDSALMRNFAIHERLTMQFRGEFYNTLNHPNFKNPNTTIGNSLYGAITADNGARVTELALRFFF